MIFLYGYYLVDGFVLELNVKFVVFWIVVRVVFYKCFNLIFVCVFDDLYVFDKGVVWFVLEFFCGNYLVFMVV